MDGGREVIMVSTGQGASRPYSYRGIAYRRVGNTTLAMSADEYNRGHVPSSGVRVRHRVDVV